MLNWKDVINYSLKGNPKPDRRVVKTDAEWRAQLTPEQYRITRNKGTEAPHSGALCSVHDAGKYACVCLRYSIIRLYHKIRIRYRLAQLYTTYKRQCH